MSDAIEFTVRVQSKLIEPRECDPIVTVYLTGDIRPRDFADIQCPQAERGSNKVGIYASDLYCLRISSGRSQKSAMVSIKESAEQKSYNAKEIQLKVRLPIDLSGLSSDSAVCVQVFCEVACGESEWGLHTCGWACFNLISVLSARSAAVPLCDQGLSDVGGRGQAILELSDVRSIEMLTSVVSGLSEERKKRPIYEPPSPSTRHRGITTYALSQYVNEVDKEFAKYRKTSEHIKIFKQPNYVSCGNCLVRPPCAFLLDSRPPKTCEEYYIDALSTVLRRRFRCMTVAEEEALAQRFLDSKFDPNENGGILMDLAMFVSTGCTYLFDEVMAISGKRLCVGEDFSRTLNLLLTGDCEDFSHHALMCLWDVLEAISSRTPGEWQTAPLRRLQEIRKKYVATLVLKSVTKPSISGSASRKSKAFGAHDCCDLIPLQTMSEMLRRTGKESDRLAATEIIDKIAKTRGVAYSDNRELSIIVGEGTGRIVTHTTSERDPSYADSSARVKAIGIFLSSHHNIGYPVYEDMTASSSFYKHSLTGIVHDTLLYARSQQHSYNEWPLPQVIYLDPTSMTLGGLHEMYAEGKIAASAVPSPDSAVMSIMQQMEKFEYPPASFDYSSTWIDKSPVLSHRFDLIRQQLLNGGSRDSPSVGTSTLKLQLGRLTEINIPLIDITESSISSIKSKIMEEGNIKIIDIVLENIVHGIAIVAFILQ